MAAAAPGSSLTLSGSCRKPGSSTMVPSRSKKTAGLATRRRDHDLALFGKNGARIEQPPAAGDARDDRRIVGAEPLGEPLVGKPREPGPELGTGERPAADLRVALDQLAAEPLGAGADALFVLSQHVQDRDLVDRRFLVAVHRERRPE